MFRVVNNSNLILEDVCKFQIFDFCRSNCILFISNKFKRVIKSIKFNLKRFFIYTYSCKSEEKLRTFFKVKKTFFY